MTRTPLSRWLSIPIAVFAGGALIWTLLWVFRGDWGWGMIALDHFGSLLLLLVGLTFLFTLFKGHGCLSTLLLPPLMLGLFLFGGYWLPQLNTDPSPPDLTVMTFNVLWENTDYPAIAQLIRTHRPDLLALQEVGPALFDYLQTELAGEYIAFQMASQPTGSTTAIVSRYPIDNVTILDLGAIRPAVIVDLTMNERRATFVSSHLLYYGWQRMPWSALPDLVELVHRQQNEQVQQLIAELVERERDLYILGCDCNSSDLSSTQQTLNGYFQNAAKATGWVIPQPRRPRLGPYYFPLRVDYIFYRGALLPRGTYTIYDNAGSDHFPVIAYFNFS